MSVRHTTFPDGWSGEVHRDGFLDWNPNTGKWDLPVPGVSVNFFDPEGNDYMTPVYDQGCDELAWRHAYRIAHRHASGHFRRA